MKWFPWKRTPAVPKINAELQKARDAYDSIRRSVPIDLVEYAVNYDERHQNRNSYRADTIGHHKLRDWLERVEAARVELQTLERVFRLKVSVCEALGVDANTVSDAGTLRAVRILQAADEVKE